MEEDGCSRLLSAGRASEDTDSVDVHIRIFLCSSLDPELSVWDSSVLEVLVAYLFELLRAI